MCYTCTCVFPFILQIDLYSVLFRFLLHYTHILIHSWLCCFDYWLSSFFFTSPLQTVLNSQALNFMPPEIEFGVYGVWSVHLSVTLSVEKTFNPGHNFWTVIDRNRNFIMFLLACILKKWKPRPMTSWTLHWK